MVNKTTCYKNPDKPTCIDLICVVETGLSDFHKMVVTVMNTSYRKSQPKIIHYRNYKNLFHKRCFEIQKSHQMKVYVL